MKKLIIVNTLKDIVKNYRSILSRTGFKIFLASTSEEVLIIHSEERVDLIIADLDMKGMAGDKLCAMIKAQKDLKDVLFIVACSNDESAITRCKKCGAHESIIKPIDIEELSHKVKNLLCISARGSMRVLVNISIQEELKNTSFFATTQDISTTGALIETDKILSQNETIKCSFFLRSNKITADAKVVRVVKKSPDTWQYGIQFLNLDQKSSNLIEEFVKKRIKTDTL